MKIADKNTKAVDLVRAALEKAKECEDYHAFISMNEAHALDRAREIDAKSHVAKMPVVSPAFRSR